MRFGHQLGERDRRLIGALQALFEGRLREAEQRYREILTRDPDDLEANWQLADLLLHGAGHLDRSWLDAREPLERMLGTDPGHKGALYHLSNISARERRLRELDSLTPRALQINPSSDWITRGQRAVVFQDTAEVARFMATMRRSSEDLAQPATGFVVFTTGDLVAGRRLWRMLTEPSRSRGVRTHAYVTLAMIEVMTGRWSAAKIELDDAEDLDSATALEYRALLSLWPLMNVPRSELLVLRNALLRWKAVPGRSDGTGLSAIHGPAHPYMRLYLLGLLSVRLGEHPTALAYATELDRRSARSFDPAFVTDWARTVRAEVSRARGQLHNALAVFDSVGQWTHERSELATNSPFYAHEYRRFARAGVLFQLGRYQEALRAYRSIADELFHSGAPAHNRLAQIYQLLGERQQAARHYARFVELWKNCDPELRPIVDEARRQISE
jgi:tetratricopeptide (TPR) repeat protein